VNKPHALATQPPTPAHHLLQELEHTELTEQLMPSKKTSSLNQVPPHPLLTERSITLNNHGLTTLVPLPQEPSDHVCQSALSTAPLLEFDERLHVAGTIQTKITFNTLTTLILFILNYNYVKYNQTTLHIIFAEWYMQTN
jgi:hypothetical protein